MAIKIPNRKSISVGNRILGFTFLIVLILVWVPAPFIGFDSHHDGLMLSTLELTRDALLNGDSLPFNQYGPFWIFPYLVTTFALPSSWAFLGMRITSILFYALTSILIFMASKYVVRRNVAILGTFIFMLSQPFVTDYGSSLVPWPSAVAMPLTAGILLIIFKIISIPDSKSTKFSVIGLGLLSVALIFTRIQIGAVILLIITLYFLTTKMYEQILIFLGTILISCIIFSFIFQSKNWLIDAINDQFVFGSSYIRGDTSTYPIPVFTFVGIFLTLSLLFSYSKLQEFYFGIKNKKYFFLFIGVFLITSAIFVLYIFSQRSYSLDVSMIIFFRRFWIAYLMGTILYAIFKWAIPDILKLVRGRLVNEENHYFLILILISSAASLQSYPLFDQMHFWWGSAPGYLVSAVVSLRVFHPRSEKFTFGKNLKFVLAFLITFGVLFPVISQISSPRSTYPEHILKGISGAPTYVASQSKLQDFFHSNLRVGEKVTNLCGNSDIFFERGFVTSANRVFVFWSPAMVDLSSYLNDFINSKPDAIITCSLNQVPKFEFSAEIEQKKIVNLIFANPVVISQIKDGIGKDWKIIRDQN